MNYEIIRLRYVVIYMFMWLSIYVVRFYSIPCLQSLPVHIEGHVHIPGVEQFPPLKQPAEHTAL